MTSNKQPPRQGLTYSNENEYQTQFDRPLPNAEKAFGMVKESFTNNGLYYSTANRFRLQQNTKTQHCKQILSQIHNLKIPKEVLQNKNKFSEEEYMKFQTVEFKEFQEFDDMLNSDTIVTIEYYYEDRSKFHKELNETKEKFTTAALELADIIQRRFPFIDVIIKNLKECDEIQEFHPYGLFEVQIMAKQRDQKGILYSKKISYLLPSPNKITEGILFFVEKTDVEVRIYDILESSQVITPLGLSNNIQESNYLEGIEVTFRQKVIDYSLNKEGNFRLYGLNKPTNKNEILSHTLGSSKSILYTREDKLDSSNINISGELSAHSKQNPVKTFMTKAVTNNQGIVKFKGIIVEIDNYEIEISPSSFFNKEKMSISLKQLAEEGTIQVAMGLKPRNIAQVNINLFDEFDPLSGAIIKISNEEIKADVSDDDEEDTSNQNDNAWLCEIRETEDSSGNYHLLAEPGLYYIQILAQGYMLQSHKVNVQKGENNYEFQMTRKVVAKVVLLAVDMFTMQPLEGVNIFVYDQDDQLLNSGFSDDIGQSVRKVELTSKLKIYTKKDGYIDLYQEYMANTTAITDKIIIKMIPKNKNPQNNFEILACFPEDIFNVSLQAICPDQTIVNEKEHESSTFNVKYDELVVGKNAVSMISYQPETSSIKNNLNLEFEIVISPKNMIDSVSTKLLKSQPSNQDLSLPLDQSACQSSSMIRKSNLRMSAASLYLSNRVSPQTPSLQSFRGSCSSIRNLDSRLVEKNTKPKATVEDTKNIVDINNCLRVYVIYKNALQDVLYCCNKNLKNKIWRVGTIQGVNNVFIKTNRPNMKDVVTNIGKSELAKQELKKDASQSILKPKTTSKDQADLKKNSQNSRNVLGQLTDKIYKTNR